MATYEDYQKVIGGLDAAKGAAEKINEFSENARALEKAAKAAEKAGDTFEKLSQAQELMKGVEAFGKLATGLGMAAMGLELALSVFGPEAPDPTELILGAIDKLDNKVDGLWNAMDSRFDEVLKKIDKAAADLGLDDEMERFNSLRADIRLFRTNPTSGEELLNNRPLGEIREHLINISYKLKPETSLNPLEATYSSTGGSMPEIISMGNKFQELAQFAPMAFALVSAIHYKNGKIASPKNAKEIGDLFEEHIENINTRVDYYIEKCRINFMSNSEADAKSMMKDLKTTGDWREGSNYRQAAKDLWEKLAPKYFWLDWFVVVGCGDIFEGKLGTYREQPNKERGSHFFNNEKCNKTTETMTILIGWRSRDIKIPPYTSQKQLDYNVLFKSPDRAQMFLNGSMGPERTVNFNERKVNYKGGIPIAELKNKNFREGGIIKDLNNYRYSIEYSPDGSKMTVNLLSRDLDDRYWTFVYYRCDAPTGSLAWLCQDRVPFSAYWNPENNINVIVACSHPQMFPTEVMDGLRKVNNLKMVDHISWLWFY